MNTMKNPKNFDRRGMTLTELMIALAIFGVIMAVLFGFLTGARNSYGDTRERAQWCAVVQHRPAALEATAIVDLQAGLHRLECQCWPFGHTQRGCKLGRISAGCGKA